MCSRMQSRWWRPPPGRHSLSQALQQNSHLETCVVDSSPELILGEESTHRLTETTSFRQRLVLFPNLRDTGEYRAIFDAGLAVAMNKTMNLTLSFQDRYDSLATSPAKQNDTLFIAGVNVKFGAQ